jgi:toxin CcdB
MARFDVFANPGQHSATTPYVVEVQSDLLDGLHTTVVIPLRRLDTMSGMAPPERLMPVFDVGGITVFLETPKLAAVPRRVLRQRVGNLADHHDAIASALDFLFHGF